METIPKLYRRVEKGKSYTYLELTQAEVRARLGVLMESPVYVKLSPQTYQLYYIWKKDPKNR